MTKLKAPNISRVQAIKAFRRAGFEIVRTRGDHTLMRRGIRLVNIPDRKHIPNGTICRIIRDSGMTREEFYRYL